MKQIEELQDRIKLLENIIAECDNAGIEYHIEDKRRAGHRIIEMFF